MPVTPSIATFYDTGTGVSSNFYTTSENVSTFSGVGGSVSSNFISTPSSGATSEFHASLSVSSNIQANAEVISSFTGTGGTLASFLSNYESEHHHHEYYSLAEFPCAICCMVPDSLCVEIKVCGQVFGTRIRKGHKPNYPADWESCGVGNAYAYMVCDQLTGMVSIFIEVVIGNGFIFAYKLPATICPFYVEWTPPGLPTVRCSQFVTEQVEYVRVYQGSCPDCPPPHGNGHTVKTVTETVNPCCAVCTCCSLMPGKDKLWVRLEAFGCDFDGAEFVLEAPINDCTWTDIIPAATTYPNCPDLIIEAQCLGGSWEITLHTDALAGCEEPFRVIVSQCDPFRVEATKTCEAAVPA